MITLKILKVLITIIILIGLAFGIAYYLAEAIGKQQEMQDVMLCESAKKSGNVEYLKKCNQ